MDQRYYQYVKNKRDVKRAHNTQQAWDREVTGKGKTQDLSLISGSAPDKQKQIKTKLAPPTAFAGQPKMGSRTGKTISARSDAPKQKKNDKLGNTFPKTFSDKIEKPPDGLFKTKNVQTLQPWKTPNQTPIMMHAPPLRVQGQKLFPSEKRRQLLLGES